MELPASVSSVSFVILTYVFLSVLLTHACHCYSIDVLHEFFRKMNFALKRTRTVDRRLVIIAVEAARFGLRGVASHGRAHRMCRTFSAELHSIRRVIDLPLAHRLVQVILPLAPVLPAAHKAGHVLRFALLGWRDECQVFGIDVDA